MEAPVVTSFFNSIHNNGLWTTLTTFGSQALGLDLYQAAREHYIQTGYILISERFSNPAQVLGAIDDIHKYEDDPTFMRQHWDDVNKRLKDLSIVLKQASQGDPEKRARNTLQSITERYGLFENEKKGISLVDPLHNAVELSDRWGVLWNEHHSALHQRKGTHVLVYLITYDSRIEQNQIRCRIIEQLQGEGLIDWDRLFPNGGNHATVRRDVEAFDRYLYTEWERGLVIKDHDNTEERKREYRNFLRDRERNWGTKYAEWRAQREAGRV